MDDLALNIFVPDEKPKGTKNPNQKLKKNSTPAESIVKNYQKPRGSFNDNVTKNGVPKPAKPVFIKSKAESRVFGSKPFLLSEQFKKHQQFDRQKNEPNQVPKNNDSEPFTVSFVKPKLFQVKRKPKSDSRDASAKGNENNVEKEFENRENSKIRLAEPEFSQNEKEGGYSKGFNAGYNNSHIGEEYSQLNSKTIDVKHKWFGAQLPASDQYAESKPNGSYNHGFSEKNNSKRKLEHKPSESKNVGFFGGKRLKHEEFRGKKGSLRSVNDVNKSSGQVSSLFNNAPLVEKLEDAGVEPLEERLFSRKTFRDVGVHPHLVKNLEQLFGITSLTVVQKKTVPVLMNGKDGLVRSQTGSGKTLAYAVPIMHSLQAITPKLSRADGVKALVVLPTRELALQTYECFTKLMRAFTWIVPGILIGGEKRKSEKARLRKGITVLVATPGRLLDHAEHTENWSLHGIDWLIIDEADKLLEMGYEKDVSQLISIINSQREKFSTVGRKQTVLLSATLTSGVESLANLTLSDPLRIDACGQAQDVSADVLVIPQSLQQKYVVVPAKLRLVALASFIIYVTEFKKSNKILIFMATQDMVDFYIDLIQSVLTATVKFYKLHGNMTQGDRTEVFNAFRGSDKGVLLSTDVAARGLDLPKVDWIVQYTAPTTPAEYVHRVGRTARVGTAGSALLFLLPSELHFVSMLNSSRIKLEEASIDDYLKCLLKIHLESKDGQRWGGGLEGAATVLQHNFEHAIIEDQSFHELACKAYKSWVRFYATYPKDLRVVFDFKSLHLGHNAKSFALRDPPRAIGGIGKPKKGGKEKDRRPKKRRAEGIGHVTQISRTKKLILSEFDSGLAPLKKK